MVPQVYARTPLCKVVLAGSFYLPLTQRRKGPRCPTYVPRVFHEAVVDDVRLRNLRHEGISRVFELDFQIQEVALVSGHTNWRTLARYTHLKPKQLVARELMVDRQGLEPR